MAFASIKNLFILLAFLTALAFVSSMAEARLLSNPSTMSVATRLKLEGNGSSNCWDSLFQLQACTGEVILFFLHGETYLGPNCCQAIRIIAHECWPNIISTLGFTTEESNMLEGYCDEAAHNPSVSPSPSIEPTKVIPK